MQVSVQCRRVGVNSYDGNHKRCSGVWRGHLLYHRWTSSSVCVEGNKCTFWCAVCDTVYIYIIHRGQEVLYSSLPKCYDNCCYIKHRQWCQPIPYFYEHLCKWWTEEWTKKLETLRLLIQRWRLQEPFPPSIRIVFSFFFKSKQGDGQGKNHGKFHYKC